MTTLTRCAWCSDDTLYQAYHDVEWGVPVYDDDRLFEFLILEGMQAGLSWITILRKRDAFRAAFSGFNATKIAQYDEDDVQRLLADAGIVRNRLKIRASIGNARAFLQTQREWQSFSTYLWHFVDGKPLQPEWPAITQVPARTEISDRMAKDLKKRGFNFVGSTICYAFMQAVGMTNDHTADCFRHKALAAGTK